MHKRAVRARRVAGQLGAKGVVAVAVAMLIWLAFLPTMASAATSNPYSGTGYDASYPNCSTPQPPVVASFGLIGVGGGRAFTSNSCAASEVQDANGLAIKPSLYYNTGYVGSFARQIDSTCAGDVGYASSVFGKLSGHKLSQAQQAWEIGCSEASYAASYAATIGSSSPVSWWADVETGNSWSTNTSLNQFALDGMSYFMSTQGGGGFYSSPSMWAKITGSSGWDTTPPMSGSWVAGTTGNCTGATLGGTSAWLVQSGKNGGLDQDTAC